MLEKVIKGLTETTELPNGEIVANDGDGFKMLLGAGNTNGTLPATENNATRFATVYACTNVLSDDIAKLPWKTYKKNDRGEISPDTDSDVHYVLAVRPNRFMTPFVFKKLAMVHLCTYGNHYSYIKFNVKGRVEELLPLDPSTTQLVYDRKNDIYGYQAVINDRTVYLMDYEVLHLKALSLDGLTGIPPIRAIKIQMETMDAAMKLNKGIIDSGNTPEGILTVEGKLGREAKEAVREGWERTNRNQKIAIVDSGLKYQQIGISQADMEFIDSMKFNERQIASIYKVPLHKINNLDHATYTNIEHQSLDYVKNTLQPHVSQWEEEVNYKLFTKKQRAEGYYSKFNMDSELRGSASERAKVQEIQIRNGMKTLNEVRGLNEDSPYEGEFALKPWMSLNNVPAENAEEYQKNKFGQTLQKSSEEKDE